jgi:hypothetical protein
MAGTPATRRLMGGGLPLAVRGPEGTDPSLSEPR